MKKGRQQGFTLLELLIATAITLVIAGMLLLTSTGVLELWRRAQGRMEVSKSAKLVFDMLERDLHGAVLLSDNKVWMAVGVTNDTSEVGRRGWFAGTAKPNDSTSTLVVPNEVLPRIENARFGLSGCWFRFITTKLDDNSNGRNMSAPSPVSYQIGRRRIGTDNSEIRYRLFRSDVRQIRSSSTSSSPGAFEIGYSLTASNYNTGSSTQADAGTIYTPASQDVIADNVVDFGIWLYREGNGGELVRIFPASSGQLTYQGPDAANAPIAADVMLRILTPEGARQISALESGRLQKPPHLTAQEWWWSVVEANSVVLSRRIQIFARPL